MFLVWVLLVALTAGGIDAAFLGLFVYKTRNKQEKSPQLLSWNGSQSPQNSLLPSIIHCTIRLEYSAIPGVFLAIPFPILLSTDV